MQKKGQIYLIGAILLIVVIFAVATVTNIAKQERFKGDFEKLSQNYEMEGSKLINTVINKETDVAGVFGNFTYAFTAYSKTQNPQFELIYVLDYNGSVNIGNYLSEPITIDDGRLAGYNDPISLAGCFEFVSASVSFGSLTASFTPLAGRALSECMATIPEPSNMMVYVSIKNQWYPFKIVPGKPQLMMVSKMEQAEQRKVFIGGAGFVREQNYCETLDRTTCQIMQKYKVCKWDQQDGICKQEEEELKKLSED